MALTGKQKIIGRRKQMPGIEYFTKPSRVKVDTEAAHHFAFVVMNGIGVGDKCNGKIVRVGIRFAPITCVILDCFDENDVF